MRRDAASRRAQRRGGAASRRRQGTRAGGRRRHRPLGPVVRTREPPNDRLTGGGVSGGRRAGRYRDRAGGRRASARVRGSDTESGRRPTASHRRAGTSNREETHRRRRPSPRRLFSLGTTCEPDTRGNGQDRTGRPHHRREPARRASAVNRRRRDRESAVVQGRLAAGGLKPVSLPDDLAAQRERFPRAVLWTDRACGIAI